MIPTDSKGKAKMDDIVFCFPIIRQDMICNALRSLHKHTKDYSYKTVVMNMSTPNREFEDELYDLCDIVIRPHVNYGFAQSASIMMRICPTPYICVANDDLVFTYSGWLRGVFETFERFETAAAVCPFSVKEPGWGWGEPGYRYLIPESHKTPQLSSLINADRALMQKVKSLKLQYEQTQTQEGLDDWRKAEKEFTVTQEQLDSIAFEMAHDPAYIAALIEEKNWMVVDGFAMFLTIWRADRLEEIGLFDEKFRDGSGEDYEWLWRSSKKGYRNLSTSRSFVYHFWGASKESPDGYNTALPSISKPWNKLSVKGFGEDGLVDPDACVWGRYGERTDPVIYRHPL